MLPNSLASIEFEWPWAVLAVLVPLLFRLFRSDNQDASQIAAPHIAAYSLARNRFGLNGRSGQRRHRRKKIFLYVIWSLLVIALMRPNYVGPPIELPLDGRDLMLAVDISPSMKEIDMPLNGQRAMRIDVVKHVVGEFAERRQGDRVGLILFGSQPYIQSPLSFDTKTVNTLLQEAFLGMAGQATAIGDAISLAVKRLRERPEQSRVLILLTDGANTAGEIPPEKAAQLASSYKIKIYTIGIGADEMLQRSLFGTRRVNPSADLDENMLKTIADSTGGQYFRARNTEELENIYTIIDELEPVETEARSYRPKKALGYYLVLLALSGFALYKLLVFVQNRQFKRKMSNAKEDQYA